MCLKSFLWTLKLTRLSGTFLAAKQALHSVISLTHWLTHWVTVNTLGTLDTLDPLDPIDILDILDILEILNILDILDILDLRDVSKRYIRNILKIS